MFLRQYIAVFLEIIAVLFLCFLAIFDCTDRTVLYAGHAVGTASAPPDRLAVIKFNDL